MDLVIDKENVYSILDLDIEKLGELTNLIKKGLKLVFNFEIDSIDPQYLGQFSIWCAGFMSGNNAAKPISEIRISENSLKTNFVNTLDNNQKQDVFLLDDDPQIIAQIQEKGLVLIGEVGSEYNTLCKLMDIESEVMQSEIADWKKFCPDLPLTDIIIADPYLLTEQNSLEELQSIFSAVIGENHKGPLNCIIIFNGCRGGSSNGRINFTEPEINAFISSIKAYIKKVNHLSGKQNKVTLVISNNLHDRNLITNYYRIKSGKGFCVHDPKDSTIEIKSHIVPSTKETTDKLIAHYQKSISLGVKTYGDNHCSFLKF